MVKDNQLGIPRFDEEQFKTLNNTGFKLIGAPSPNKEKTIIVVGTARSGTSAIAGMLNKLGVFMGATADQPIFEDVHLTTKIESGATAEALEIIGAYNQEHQTWGFKRPSFIQHLSDYHHQFRNPCYIIVFRDLLAVANRAEISHQLNIVNMLNKLLKDMEQIIRFVSQHNPTALLVSYEKLLNNPADFVNQVISFCDLQPNATQLQTAIDSIVPSPQHYLEMSRINKTRGRLDIANQDGILGWAQYTSQREKIPTVSLLANDKEIIRVQANQFRQDLLDMKISTTGRCAFKVSAQQITQLNLKHGDTIRAKVDDDIFDLRNSPQTYSNNAGLFRKVKRFLFD